PLHAALPISVGFIDDRATSVKKLLSEVPRARAVRAEVKQRVAQARGKVRLASLALTGELHIDPIVTLVAQQSPQTMIALVPPNKEQWMLIADGLTRRPELKES